MKECMTTVMKKGESSSVSVLEECVQKECDSDDESAFINLYEKFINNDTDEDMSSVNVESNNNDAKGENVLAQEEINASRPSESTHANPHGTLSDSEENNDVDSEESNEMNEEIKKISIKEEKKCEVNDNIHHVDNIAQEMIDRLISTIERKNSEMREAKNENNFMTVEDKGLISRVESLEK